MHLARACVAETLSELGDARAVGPLIAALRDPQPGVRFEAAWVLGKLRDPAALGPLAAALKDSNAKVRAHAAYALGQLADKRAVAPLIAALKDDNSFVATCAAQALGELADRRALGPLLAAVRTRHWPSCRPWPTCATPGRRSCSSAFWSMAASSRATLRQRHWASWVTDAPLSRSWPC